MVHVLNKNALLSTLKKKQSKECTKKILRTSLKIMLDDCTDVELRIHTKKPQNINHYDPANHHVMLN